MMRVETRPQALYIFILFFFCKQQEEWTIIRRSSRKIGEEHSSSKRGKYSSCTCCCCWRARAGVPKSFHMMPRIHQWASFVYVWGLINKKMETATRCIIFFSLDRLECKYYCPKKKIWMRSISHSNFACKMQLQLGKGGGGGGRNKKNVA